MEVPARREPAQAQVGLSLLGRVHAQQHQGLLINTEHCTNSNSLPEDAGYGVAASYGINMARMRWHSFMPGQERIAAQV